MQAADFDFELPDALIARFPPARRGDSRLLCLDPARHSLADAQFCALPGLLERGDLLVVNDVRVMPARLRGVKSTGGVVEVLLDRVLDTRRALAQVRASKSPRAGMRLHLGVAPQAFDVVVVGRDGALFELELADGAPADDWPGCLSIAGEVPLPPYLGRPAQALDDERYQTVYAREPAAVAAPTAGLHFDQALLALLEARGIERCALTLNVGSGTFAPLRDDALERNVLHAEWAEVPASVCAAVAACKARGGRVVAVGTTCVRALETAAQHGHGGDLQPWRGDTRLFIYPGFEFQCVDALITNFHLPRSTLLMLVCAFAGTDLTLDAYRHAVAAGYRFYSYGDAMFISHRLGQP